MSHCVNAYATSFDDKENGYSVFVSLAVGRIVDRQRKRCRELADMKITVRYHLTFTILVDSLALNPFHTMTYFDTPSISAFRQVFSN